MLPSQRVSVSMPAKDELCSRFEPCLSPPSYRSSPSSPSSPCRSSLQNKVDLSVSTCVLSLSPLLPSVEVESRRDARELCEDRRRETPADLVTLLSLPPPPLFSLSPLPSPSDPQRGGEEALPTLRKAPSQEEPYEQDAGEQHLVHLLSLDITPN